MTEHHFETHEPVDLQVETGKGTVHVTCADTTESGSPSRAATPTRSASSRTAATST